LTVQIFSPVSVDPNVRKGYVVPFYWDEKGDATATGNWGDGLIGDRKMVNLLIEEVPEVYPGWEVVDDAKDRFNANTGDILDLNDKHLGNEFDNDAYWDEDTDPPSLRADIVNHGVALDELYAGAIGVYHFTAEGVNVHYDRTEYAESEYNDPNITPPYLVSTLIERTS
jgi:hypothetical protein